MPDIVRLITPSAEIPGDSAREPDRTLPCFDDFWVLYPRHVAKLAARKAWARVNPSAHVAILEALVSWRPVWRDKDPEYLPHAATWLNGERWEDELPQGFRKREETPFSGVSGNDQAPQARTTIPAHVQSVIDRIRGKKKPA
jgi:hypothetical protein